MLGQKIDPRVDQLGTLEARISELKAQADVIKASLKADGENTYFGVHYKSVVGAFTRSTLSVDACREKLESLNVSAQWFAAHTSHTDVVNCTTRPFTPAEKRHQLIARVSAAA